MSNTWLSAECFPAGRRLLQHPDAAAAQAECGADGFRQPSDGGEERSEEPNAPTGRREPTLPAGGAGDE